MTRIPSWVTRGLPGVDGLASRMDAEEAEP